MKSGRLIVGLLALFLVILFVASLATVAYLIKEGDFSGSEEGRTLVLRLGGALPEQPSPDDPLAGLGGAQQPPSMLDIDQALRRAATDDSIGQLLLEPVGLQVGYGKLQELIDGIQRFRADSGKPVTCWMEAVSNKEYYLATACDRVYMAPEGFFLVNGLSLSVTFYKGTLDKLGVEAEFTRAGKYKSAIEPLTSTEMSPAYRTMLNELADDLYESFVQAISEARELSPAQVRALVDDPPLTAAAAVREGLLDGLLYRDQLDDLLAGADILPEDASRPDMSWVHDGPAQNIRDASAQVESGDDTQVPSERAVEDEESIEDAEVASDAGDDQPLSTESGTEKNAEASDKDAEDLEAPDRVGLSSYLGERDKRKTPKRRIGLLYADGAIVSGRSGSGAMGGSQMGSDTIAKAIRQLRKDDQVEALVIRVNSPGGSGLASDIIWREIELTRQKKPVVVSMSDYAASGGYYISMNADAIVAQPGTITGSIGVYAGKYNLSGLFDKMGLKTESIKRGEYADLFSAEKPLGDDGLEKLSEFVDEFYGVFVTKAAQGRAVDPAAIHAVAQGRVWTGRQAHELGLIDELGSLRTAIAIAKEKAGITGDVGLTVRPRKPTLIEELLGQDVGFSILTTLLDRVGGSGDLSQTAKTVAAGLPAFAEGKPVLLAPFHLEAN